MVELQINVNGYVSLGYPSVDPYPRLFLTDQHVMIAPFWADLELTKSGGAVYYQQYARNFNRKTSESAVEAHMFNATTELIRDNVGDTSFEPTMIIKITWQNIAPYPAENAGATEVC